MDNLFDEAPEAFQFCRDVEEEIAKYKLFDREEFSELRCCVLTTSGKDMQGDSFRLKALVQGVREINQNGLWLSVQHDPLLQPYGRVLAAKLFYAPKSQVHFIAAVMAL